MKTENHESKNENRENEILRPGLCAHDTFIRCEYHDQDKRLNELLEKYEN